MLRMAGLVILLAAAVICGGCFGGSETDEITYVIAIGLDTAPDNEIKATYQIAVPRGLSSEEGKSGSSKASDIITIQAANLAEARSLLNSISSRQINLSHARMFVFSEEYARKGMSEFMAVAMRFREFRGTMYVAVVKNGTAEEFLRQNKPTLETLQSKYLHSLVATADSSGYFLPSSVHEFYRRLKSNKGSPYAMLFGLNPQTGVGNTEGELVKGDVAKEYTAGSIPRTGNSNPVELLGTAVFVGEKMAGTLTGQETRMISILQGHFKQGYIVVADPLEPEKSVNVVLRLDRKPKIKCRLEQGQLKIAADVMLEGEITNVPSGIHYEASKYSHIIERQVNQLIEREMSRTLRKTQDIGSDVVGFGAYAARLFDSYDDYKNFNFEAHYPQAEITLSIKTTIRRTGLMWQTTPLPDKDKQ